MKVLTVVGTRPNIIKITQFQKVANAIVGMDHKLVHTGQHYNHNLSKIFFDELQVQEPDFHIDANKDSLEQQKADIYEGIINTCKTFQPDVLVVVGDVNSTLIATQAGKSLGIPVAHVESGLRSFDMTMPEERNRIKTDKVADIFFTTEESGNKHLAQEGVPADKVHFVGNTMIDTLVAFDHQIQAADPLSPLGLKEKEFVLMTMHRPGNVDSLEGLNKLIDTINFITNKEKIIFPIHPRTKKRIEEFGLNKAFDANPNLILSPPVGYIDFQSYIFRSKYVITDSGGIQEETTFRQIPCLTLRPNTERPVTIDLGTNTLLPFEIDAIEKEVLAIRNGSYKKGSIPPLWDGKATHRIFEALNRY